MVDGARSPSRSPSRSPRQTRSRQSWLTRAGVAAAVLLLVGVGVRSFVDARREVEANQLVSHTHEVIEALQGLLTGLGTAESALRGYALSGDPTLLADVGPGMELLRGSLTTVRALVDDHPEQLARIEALAPVVEARLSLMAKRLQARETAFSTEAQALSERLRRGVAEMMATERRLLEERRKESERRSERAMWTTPLATLVGVLLFFVVFAVLSGEMRQRRKTEAALSDRLSELRLLARLNELLASCRAVGEAYDVVGRLAPGIVAGDAGSIAVFRASRDVLEQHAPWGAMPSTQPFAADDCWALRRGRPHRSGGENDVACAHFGAGFSRSALCVPLLAHGEVLGALHVVGDVDDDGARVASVVGESVALAVANLQLKETLKNQSLRDPLTGLFNRRYTEETFGRELARAAREKQPLSVLMLDVDHFKRFNDTFGHEAGDHVLKELAAVLQKQTRGSDVAARLGGEELCVLLPGASAKDAARRAEEIRKAVSSLTLAHRSVDLGRVTTSIGVATAPDHAKGVEELLRAADAALYRAKREGRDRVVVAADDAVSAPA